MLYTCSSMYLCDVLQFMGFLPNIDTFWVYTILPHAFAKRLQYSVVPMYYDAVNSSSLLMDF